MITHVCSTDSPHRSDPAVSGERALYLPAAELRSTIRVQHTPRDVTAAKHDVVQRSHRKRGRHLRVDGITHDPVRPHIFHRAQVELAFTSPMLSDVRKPQLVRGSGHELALHEIVMNSRAWLPAFPAGFLLAKRRPPLLITTKPPRSPVTHRLAEAFRFVCEEPISELGVFKVSVVERVCSIRLRKVPFSDWAA